MSRNAVESFGRVAGETPLPNARAEANLGAIKENRPASGAASSGLKPA
jgi:hypothetical protein